MPLKNSGKQIKDIKFLKSGIRLTFYSGEKLVISQETYTSKLLYKNKILSYEDYALLKQSVDLKKHINYVHRLITKTFYSEYKIREKLYNKQLSKKDIDFIIAYFKKLNLIDDMKFAKEYASYLKCSHYGKNKIIYLLSKKGIFKEVIAQIHFSYQEELFNAAYWLKSIENRYGKKNMTQKKNYATNFLLNKGFDYDVINETIKHLKINNAHQVNISLKNDLNKTKTRLKNKYHGKQLKEKIIQNLLQKGYKMKEIIQILED